MYIGVQRDILRELDLIVVHTLQKNMFIDTVQTLQSNVLASMASNWDSSFYHLLLNLHIFNICPHMCDGDCGVKVHSVSRPHVLSWLCV